MAIDPQLLAFEALYGLQLGVMLFLMAAGLTLVFGIMNLINLAHGSLYMVGAYLAATLQGLTGSFILAGILAIPATLALGVAVEVLVLRTLYDRDHLDQVLATFGLILFFNEAVRVVWGPSALFMTTPDFLSGQVTLPFDIVYPSYRFAIIAVGLVVALFLYVLISHTRIGMLIRAGASNRAMVGALGVDVKFLYTAVFALGTALAGIAGLMAGPILSVESGMGEPILILTFVVIVIGGIGSIRGAFLAAVLIGVVDTLGRSFLPALLRAAFNPSVANAAGPALASMLIYVLMALVLTFRPQGLFPARG
jgi:branched-chain amino acid transport system permease protein